MGKAEAWIAGYQSARGKEIGNNLALPLRQLSSLQTIIDVVVAVATPSSPSTAGIIATRMSSDMLQDGCCGGTETRELDPFIFVEDPAIILSSRYGTLRV